MNIGFDLDKVFIDLPPFVSPKIIDRLYKKRDNGILIYRIPSPPEQLFRRATHAPFLRPAIKENLQFLKNIPQKNNKLYVISSRFKFLQKRTEKLIKKYGLDKIFDAMYFNYEDKQPHVFKNEILKKLNLDIYVDDDLSLIKHVAKFNPKTYFFWLNQDGNSEPISKNIFAVTKLEDIFKGKGLSVKGKDDSV